VPLGRSIDVLDVPARLELPVLLVVGIRLGCINHALLSALAICARGLRLAGWVANRVDAQMLEGDANVEALADRLPAPLLADFAWRNQDVQAFTVGRSALRELGFGSPAHD
jgi:dethiobiotin synthetase